MNNVPYGRAFSSESVFNRVAAVKASIASLYFSWNISRSPSA
jgi:hypothetical protein